VRLIRVVLWHHEQAMCCWRRQLRRIWLRGLRYRRYIKSITWGETVQGQRWLKAVMDIYIWYGTWSLFGLRYYSDAVAGFAHWTFSALPSRGCFSAAQATSVADPWTNPTGCCGPFRLAEHTTVEHRRGGAQIF
jgi:hypothetical protein